MTFRRRLTLLSAAAVAVSIVVASVIVFFVVRAGLRSEVDDSLRELASGAAVIGRPAPPPTGLPDDARGEIQLPAPRIERALERDGTSGSRQGLALALPTDPAGAPGGVGQLVGERGDILPAPGDPQGLPVTEATLAVAAGDRGAFFTDAQVGGTHLRVLTAPARSRARRPPPWLA